MQKNDVTLSICLRCRDGQETRAGDLSQRAGRKLARAVVDAFAGSEAERAGVSLRDVHCMSQCKRACIISLTAPGCFSYIFGDLAPEQHAAQVLEVAARYAEAETGFLERAQRPEALRAGILGRIPPEGHDSDLIEPLTPSQTQLETK